RRAGVGVAAQLAAYILGQRARLGERYSGVATQRKPVFPPVGSRVFQPPVIATVAVDQVQALAIPQRKVATVLRAPFGLADCILDADLGQRLCDAWHVSALVRLGKHVSPFLSPYDCQYGTRRFATPWHEKPRHHAGFRAIIGIECDGTKLVIGAPCGTRTRVTAVRGRCPGPLDEGSVAPRSALV